jgi:hypothetical protein
MELAIVFWYKVDYSFAIVSYDGRVIRRYHSAMYLPLFTDNYGIGDSISVQSLLLFRYCVLRWSCILSNKLILESHIILYVF